MDKKALQSYHAMELELDQLLELITRVEARIQEAKTAKYSAEPKGKGAASDVIGANLARLESLRERYYKRVGDLSIRMADIETAIEKLEPIERVLMRARYIECKEWKDIAERLHYSERHTTKLHGVILEKIKKHAPLYP